jgi:HEPN domain-containing protein
MNKFKGKYEYILGFVTIVISGSVFKDELNSLNLNLGYSTITMFDYFKYSIAGFCVCLYLYVLELMSRDTKVGSWKLFDYGVRLAYYLFSFILLSPLLVCINVVLIKFIDILPQKYETAKSEVVLIINLIVAVSSLILSIASSAKKIRAQQIRHKEAISEQEIIDLENSMKLYNNGHYSQSIFEAFKVLELHLYKKLIEKGVRVSQRNFSDLVNQSLKEKLITPSQDLSIREIKEMRNMIAHLEIDYTKERALSVLEFIKGLLKSGS